MHRIWHLRRASYLNLQFVVRDAGVNGILLLSTLTTCATFMRIEIFYAMLLLKFMVIFLYFRLLILKIGVVQGIESH